MSRMKIDRMEIQTADIFEILLDNFPDMIHSIDDDGCIVYTNRTAEKLLGYTREELLGMNIRELYSPEVLADLERGFTELKKRGDKRVESVLAAKDGSRIPVEIRSFSIYDDAGEFLRTFSILRDIRPIKELQDSLVHAGRLAAIGELASGVAHDINNPLTVILLSNELLQRELARDTGASAELASRLKLHSANVLRAATSIQKLSEHLRNFSRGMAEDYETLDLFGCLADSLFIVDSRVRKVGAEIVNEVPGGRHFVHACANRMEQVFVNLIGNACDAVEGHKERRITISVRSVDHQGVGCWSVDVTDTGIGIPAHLLPQIFGSFFTTKEKGKGTGLGLSISRGIIRDLKGDIEVRSQPGEGSTFSVILPKRVSDQGEGECRMSALPNG